MSRVDLVDAFIQDLYRELKEKKPLKGLRYYDFDLTGVGTTLKIKLVVQVEPSADERMMEAVKAVAEKWGEIEELLPGEAIVRLNGDLRLRITWKVTM